MNLENYKLKNCQSILLVFLDGIFCPEFSLLAPQIQVETKPKFFLKIKPDIRPITVVHLLYLSSDKNKQENFNIDNTIEIANNAAVILLEEYAFTGNYTIKNKLHLAENAKLDYFKIQNSTANIASNFHADLNAKSILNYQNAILHGNNLSENIIIQFHGEHANSKAFGFYKLQDEQKIDLNYRVEHLAANCNSYQNFKGIIDGNAAANFSGRIIVPQNAIKSEGVLTNKNLLLSDRAKVKSLPELEIYTDDVKCSHGSAVGQLDQQALYYLRTRGFSLPFAKQILIDAFANEILAKFPEFLQEKLK